jgi:hypothetical protein
MNRCTFTMSARAARATAGRNFAMKKILLFTTLCALSLYFTNSVASQMDGVKSHVTFAKHVAPILQNRCQECHRAGGVAPMSLVTYEETRPWARALREKVVNRTMPPFHATGAIGRYQHDPRLTDDEIATITKWVDSGAPKGNAPDLPKPRAWKNDWLNGTPDVVVTAKQPFTIKPSKKDQYAFFVFDYVFPEDTWIKSVETRPGNLAAVHHANTHVVPPMFKAPPEGVIAGDFDPGARGTVMLSGWAPGVQPVTLVEGTGIKIPKGMRLGIQIHYAPSDVERTDQTSVGVYFADGTINKHLKTLFGDRRDLAIQPNDANYSLTATKMFETDAVIRFFHVHMHLRGKAYKFRFTFPDGRVEDVFDVQNYDFNWQRVYLLKEPLRVPKGTKVDFIGTYDNSAKNKFNPDPAQTVKWGEKTTDEMMQGRIFYEAADEMLNVKVKKGRAMPSDAAKMTN